ncbi:MAG: F0F1 ATP synthase subunit delta [Candidatus Saccharimonadales bacterium]
MATRLSRRKIAEYYGKEILKGTSLKQLTQELSAFLIDTRRTRELVLIVRDIEDVLARSGTVIADVTSIEPLDETAKKSISALVSTVYNTTELHIRQHIDATIIGGVHIQLPNEEFDGTLRHKLTRLSANKL